MVTHSLRKKNMFPLNDFEHIENNTNKYNLSKFIQLSNHILIVVNVVTH